ncbi:MAG TPA: S9 family peptidase, partial [Candidatus Angelobacter sp.]|nr:S9 family peptidase [Candidatus Angelobacter sp.]
MNLRSTRLNPTALCFGPLAIVLTLVFSASCFAQEPPLIPRKVIDAAADHDLLTISPNGKMIAYTAPSDKGVSNIWVEDLAMHQKRMVTRATRGINGYQWAYD